MSKTQSKLPVNPELDAAVKRHLQLLRDWKKRSRLSRKLVGKQNAPKD